VDEYRTRQIVVDTPRLGQLSRDLYGQLDHIDDVTGLRSGMAPELKGTQEVPSWILGAMWEALMSARTLLVVWTPNAAKAPGVERELKFFDKKVVFACINGTRLPEYANRHAAEVHSVRADLGPVLAHLHAEINRATEETAWRAAWPLITDALILHRLSGDPVTTYAPLLELRGSVELLNGDHYLAAESLRAVCRAIKYADPQRQAALESKLVSVLSSWFVIDSAVSERVLREAEKLATHAVELVSEASSQLGLAQLSGILAMIQARLAKRRHATNETSDHLVRALLSGDVDEFERLLSAGHAPTVTDADGTPILCLAAHSGRFEFAEELLRRGVDVNATAPGGYAALYFAVDFGHGGVVETMLRHGASIRDHARSASPIERAIAGNRREIVRLLLKHGTDPNGAIGDRLPLILAARHGVTDVAEVLLDAGARADATDPCGRRALIMAATVGDVKMIEFLLSRKADINAVDADGQSALYVATTEGHLHAVETLLNLGARTDLRTAKGHRALDAG